MESVVYKFWNHLTGTIGRIQFNNIPCSVCKESITQNDIDTNLVTKKGNSFEIRHIACEEPRPTMWFDEVLNG